MSVVSNSPLPISVAAGVAIPDVTIELDGTTAINGIQCLNLSGIPVQFFRGSTSGGQAFQQVLPGQQSTFNAGASQVTAHFPTVPTTNGVIDLFWTNAPLVSLTSTVEAATPLRTPFVGPFYGQLAGNAAGNALAQLPQFPNVTYAAGQKIYVTDVVIDYTGTLAWRIGASIQGGFSAVAEPVFTEPKALTDIATPFFMFSGSSGLANFEIVAYQAYAGPIPISGYVGGYIQ